MKAAWIKLAALAAVIAGLVILLKTIHIDVARLTPEQIRAFVRASGPWAPVAYLLIFGQPLVPLPISVLIMAAGLVFGLWWGALIALAGLTLRASTQFAVARLLGREAVAGLLKGGAQRLEQRIAAKGFLAVAFVRLVPNVPADLQSYAFGFSSVRFAPYAVGTLVGSIPWTVLFVYLGYSLTDFRTILLALVLIVAAALAVLWIRHRRAARRPTPAA